MTRKRRRPGDVFFVPLGDGVFAFGRFTPQSGVVDFYWVKSGKLLDWNTLRGHATFRLPQHGMVPDRPFIDGEWRIYDHADYPMTNFTLTAYRMGALITTGAEVVRGFIQVSGKTRLATDEELQTVPALSIHNKLMVEFELREALLDAPIVTCV